MLTIIIIILAVVLLGYIEIRLLIGKTPYWKEYNICNDCGKVLIWFDSTCTRCGSKNVKRWVVGRYKWFVKFEKRED